MTSEDEKTEQNEGLFLLRAFATLTYCVLWLERPGDWEGQYAEGKGTGFCLLVTCFTYIIQ